MSDHPERDEIRLTDGAFYAGDPHRSFQWMREHAPVYWDASGQVWGVARYADVLAISKDPQTFSNAGGMRPDQPPLPNMINLDDPAHKNQRGLGIDDVKAATAAPLRVAGDVGEMQFG